MSTCTWWSRWAAARLKETRSKAKPLRRYGRGTLEGLAANDNGDELQQRSLELKMGYGFAVFGNRFTGTPEVGLRLSNGHREMSLGWRLALERAGPVSMELGIEATRREAANDAEEPVNALMLHTQIRW